MQHDGVELSSFFSCRCFPRWEVIHGKNWVEVLEGIDLTWEENSWPKDFRNGIISLLSSWPAALFSTEGPAQSIATKGFLASQESTPLKTGPELWMLRHLVSFLVWNKWYTAYMRAGIGVSLHGFSKWSVCHDYDTSLIFRKIQNISKIFLQKPFGLSDCTW